MSWKHGDAHGERNCRERPSSVLNAYTLAVFAQFFGALPGDFQGCVGHNQEEFFPADTAGYVFAPNLRIEHGAQFAQNDIAVIGETPYAEMKGDRASLALAVFVKPMKKRMGGVN